MSALVIVRDIHFASSIIVAGVVFFDLFVASPVLRSDLRFSKAQFYFREAADNIFWISLALSMASAVAWLCLLSMRITGKAFGNVIADGTIWIVLSQTQVGFAWEMRLYTALGL